MKVKSAKVNKAVKVNVTEAEARLMFRDYAGDNNNVKTTSIWSGRMTRALVDGAGLNLDSVNTLDAADFMYMQDCINTALRDMDPADGGRYTFETESKRKRDNKVVVVVGFLPARVRASLGEVAAPLMQGAL